MERNATLESWHRILDWSTGDAAAQRFAAGLLHIDGFECDLIHPGGGPDGRRDIALKKVGIEWVGAVFFPRGEKSFNVIKKKFEHDLEGVAFHKAGGFVFVVNQDITDSEREELRKRAGVQCEIYHLERINTLVNGTLGLSLRCEFLQLEATPEGLVSYIAGRDAKQDKQYETINQQLEKVLGALSEPKRMSENQAQSTAILPIKNVISQTEQNQILNRIGRKEVRRQRNIKSVLARASEEMNTASYEAPISGINDEWVERFIDECQDVSDERMHDIWARLLAGEFKSPGAFPKRIFRLLKDLEPSEAEYLDQVASQVLVFEDSEGELTDFLNVDIYEEWMLGIEKEKKLLGTTWITNVELLHSLNFIERKDLIFAFFVEGSIEPTKVHLSKSSARQIIMGERHIIPEYIQPQFVRRKGPTTTGSGHPMINAWMKQVIFDAWAVSNLGKQFFKLSKRAKDYTHFNEVRDILLKSGIQLKSDGNP